MGDDDGGLDRAIRAATDAKEAAAAAAQAEAARREKARAEATARVNAAAAALAARARRAGLPLTELQWSDPIPRASMAEQPPRNASRVERRQWKRERRRQGRPATVAKTHSVFVWTVDPGTAYDSYSMRSGRPAYYVAEDGRLLTNGASRVEEVDPGLADYLVGLMASLLVR